MRSYDAGAGSSALEVLGAEPARLKAPDVTEQAIVRRFFRQLRRAVRSPFPRTGQRLDCPTCQGVYVIFDRAGRVAHVGRTTRARAGLRQRLKAHLAGRSSFVIKHLRGQTLLLRRGYSFSFVEVAEPRTRALLEAYATGVLCPRHLGTGLLLT
jgi:hypothetical protein